MHLRWWLSPVPAPSHPSSAALHTSLRLTLEFLDLVVYTQGEL